MRQKSTKWGMLCVAAGVSVVVGLGVAGVVKASEGRLTPYFFMQWALPALAGGQSDGANLDVPAMADAATVYDEQESPDSDTISFEVMEVDKNVSPSISFELLETAPMPVTVDKNKPQVLIYHTHTTEAYNPTEKDPYVKTSDWRTNDAQKNILRVGEELTRILTEQYGLNVIHDVTNHEPPYLGTAYERSWETMQKYHEQYPEIELFIDLHRDAYTLKEGQKNTDFVVIDGKQVAKCMFVVGTGEGKTGAGFAVKPNYAQNYALALEITQKLQKLDPKLARPIRVKTGRYNQHIPGRSLLIEMGHNANTLEEVLNCVPYMATAIAQSINTKSANIFTFN